jgi:hypothetical protein
MPVREMQRRVALAEQQECLALLDTKIGTYGRSVAAAQPGDR